jgi:hypothetical protein
VRAPALSYNDEEIIPVSSVPHVSPQRFHFTGVESPHWMQGPCFP